jgi:two-component system NtrC family sensor kinase
MMATNSGDEAALRSEIIRLNKIIKALMDRAEREMSTQRSNFGLFQTTIMLEGQVRSRTRELEAALRENETITRALRRATGQMELEIEERKRAHQALEAKEAEQRVLIEKLKDAHLQLLQSEKMASIGQLAAGVAHEINNPIGFVSSNLGTLRGYADALLKVVDAYETLDTVLAAHPQLLRYIEEQKQLNELAYVRDDIRTLIAESIEGTTRVRNIVQNLRDFSHVDQGDWQQTNLHAGLDSTLSVARNEIKHKAKVIKDYGELPLVECLPSQINQVFLNLLVNAAQAITDQGTITIRTRADDAMVCVAISDTGSGMAPEVLAKVFDPFFTTKPVGQGTGLGLAVSFGIVEQHGGRIEVESTPGAGTTFSVMLPVCHRAPAADAGGSGS